MIIAGKNKGKISTIEQVVDNDYVVVKDVNVVKKAVKGQGFVKKTLPIHISNVMYYLEKEKKPVKIEIVVEKNGTKKRRAKKFEVVVD